MLPEPVPPVYCTSVEDQLPSVYRHCSRTQTGHPFEGSPETVLARVPLGKLPLLYRSESPALWPIRRDQSVRAAPLAVQEKVTVEPGKGEPGVGVKRAGCPLPLLLVLLLLVLLPVLLELLVVLPDPVPVVYWTS